MTRNRAMSKASGKCRINSIYTELMTCQVSLRGREYR